MIIVFPVSENNGVDGEVYKDFGSAPLFFWYNVETGENGCVDNDGCDDDDGGKSAVACVGELGAEAVIVKEIGCAAVNRLRGVTADTYAASGGKIFAEIEKYKNGNLRRMFAGDCDGCCKK